MLFNMQEAIHILQETTMITGFVMVMMLIIEFLNVRTDGRWSNMLKAGSWQQYVFAGLICLVPGCLGPYLIVSLYTHNFITFGALLTAFITTTGDESFVMLSLFPNKAIMLSGILFTIGLVVGIITDKVHKSAPVILSGKHFDHDHGCVEIELSLKTIFRNIRHMSFPRAILIAGHLVFLAGIFAGYFSESGIHGHSNEVHSHGLGWINTSFALTTFIALLIVSVVPDHFLEDHLWGHIIKKHFPRIFLWTLGILILIAVTLRYFDLQELIHSNKLPFIALAILIGYIPVSGPHLIFVSLFAQGVLPFSILLANSIVQDGHGSLPLLAESKKSFVKLKLIKTVIALLAGVAGMLWSF
jgi:hypothetical protein